MVSEPTMKFSSKFFKPLRRTRFHRFFVYGWIREKIYLYIGSTSVGRKRFFNHHIFKEYTVKKDDSAYVWICESAYKALELEKELIKAFIPLLNRVDNPEYRTKSWMFRDSKPRGKNIIKPKRKTIILPKVEIYRPIPAQELAWCSNKKEYNAVLKKYSLGKVINENI